MDSGIAGLIIYSIVVFALTLVGGLIPLTRQWRQRHLGLLTAFAGGVLLGAAFLHMIPEASAHAPVKAGIAALIGLLLMFFLERTVAVHFCEHDHDECDHFQVMGYAFYIGLTLHSVIDGLVLGSGALMPELGLIVFIAIAAHKLPAVFSMSSILMAGGFRHKRVLWLIAVLSLSTPVGAFAAYYGLRGVDPDIWHVVIGLSAGTFLYIAISDLLPTAQWRGWAGVRSTVALLLGIAIMWGAGLIAH